MSSSTQKCGRGVLIVLEGCDRSGKTTLSRRLVEELNSRRMETEAMRFPDRTTLLGKFLDGYLRGENQLSDQSVHLLFSANRWEKVAEMEERLAAGTNLVVDR